MERLSPTRPQAVSHTQNDGFFLKLLLYIRVGFDLKGMPTASAASTSACANSQPATYNPRLNMHSSCSRLTRPNLYVKVYALNYTY